MLMNCKDILIYSSDGEFLKADYPWCKHIRITIQGGRGGASSDGTPGQLGESSSMLLDTANLPDHLSVVIGKGGKGAPGAQDGEDGLVIVELYD